MKKIILLSLYLTLIFSPVLAQDHSNHHTDHDLHIYGPIGVMGEHPHSKGEWMTSYNYSSMQMKNNRNGTKDIPTSNVLADFMVAPKKMTMQMHMFGLMYGVSDRLTIMGMMPYKTISMDHVNRMGAEFTTKSKGIGDIKLMGLYTVYEQGQRRLMLNAGITIPTGSIDERDDTPAGLNQKLPYPMQLGSGTYDLSPAITYVDGQGKWSWGSQLNSTLRLGTNDNNYSLGNEYGLTSWTARQINEYASVSLRLDGKMWGNIDGNDFDLNPMVVPTARTDLRGGERIDLLIGVNLLPKSDKFGGNRFAIEAGMPIYQDLNGPQLATDYRLTLGWQLVF